MMTTISSYLGPAEVVSPVGESGLIEIRLLDGESVSARLALAMPYCPAVGDEVLVISQGASETYVIGVLRWAAMEWHRTRRVQGLSRKAGAD